MAGLVVVADVGATVVGTVVAAAAVTGAPVVCGIVELGRVVIGAALEGTVGTPLLVVVRGSIVVVGRTVV